MYVCRGALVTLPGTIAMGCHRALGIPPGAKAYILRHQSQRDSAYSVSDHSACDRDANALIVLHASMYMLLMYWDVYMGILWVSRRTVFFDFGLVNIL